MRTPTVCGRPSAGTEKGTSSVYSVVVVRYTTACPISVMAGSSSRSMATLPAAAGAIARLSISSRYLPFVEMVSSMIGCSSTQGRRFGMVPPNVGLPLLRAMSTLSQSSPVLFTSRAFINSSMGLSTLVARRS